jgi:hypothetical protein
MTHRITRLAVAAMAAGSIVVAAAGIAAAAVSPTDQTTMVSLHNTLRQNTAASETQRLGKTVTIGDLTWNPDAATVAQAWADHLLATNTFEHNANRGDFGENIYFESGSDPATSATRAFQSWAAEVSDYNYDANSCAATCGHYTQIVWAATTSVGCGMATDGTTTLWVCDYAPPGNFVGQRPYEPGAAAAAAAPAASAPADTTQPADTSQPVDTTQPVDTSQPADTSQPTDTPQPPDTPAA